MDVASQMRAKNLMVECESMNEYRTTPTSGSTVADRLLLVGAALLVCVITIGALQLADKYHVAEKWVLIAYNSIWFILIVGRQYRTYSPKATLVVFFGFWMVLHGVLATILLQRVALLYWLPIYAFEFALGYWGARRLFGSRSPG